MKVQLKPRLFISHAYGEKGLHIAFMIRGEWYIILHDRLVELVGEHTSWLKSTSWRDGGAYHSRSPSAALKAALEPFKLG